MLLACGSRIGSCEVVGPLGAGGRLRAIAWLMLGEKEKALPLLEGAVDGPK